MVHSAKLLREEQVRKPQCIIQLSSSKNVVFLTSCCWNTIIISCKCIIYRSQRKCRSCITARSSSENRCSKEGRNQRIYILFKKYNYLHDMPLDILSNQQFSKKPELMMQSTYAHLAPFESQEFGVSECTFEYYETSIIQSIQTVLHCLESRI